MGRCILIGLAFTMSGCFNGLLLKPVHCDAPIAECKIYDAHSRCCRKKVAVIDVDGVLMNCKTSGLLSDGDNPVSLFREKLDAAACDKRVKAVVLRINSPGGGVTASDIMYQDLRNFKNETGKPVVACMMDVACSGAYYLAMGCDRVYAHPTTVTGSIGVIMSLYNAHGMLSMLGVKSDPIKSGPNKDLGNPARPMTDEERKILQGLVNAFYDEFVEVVATGRKMPEDEVRKLADGRIYTGLEAQKLGLVDEVGYLEDAIQCAMEIACLCDARVVAYDKCGGYRGSCYARGVNIPSQINVKLDVPGLAGQHGAATFMYLWEPGVK